MQIKPFMYRLVDKIAYKLDMKRRFEKANRHTCNLSHKKLTHQEQKMFRIAWGGCKSISYEFYKAYGCVFNQDMVPDDYYEFAEHVLNLRWAAYFMQHKQNLKMFFPKHNRAETILQRIDGHFVLEDNTEISINDAIKILQQEREFIVKQAFGPGGGKGVQKITSEVPRLESFHLNLFKWNDMVFERVIKQHEFMSQFNPDSVNTIRFVTLNINGRCTVQSAFIRMGAKGSFKDNLSGGKGVLVGVNKEGYLNAFGIDHTFNKHYVSTTGVRFEGLYIPNYHTVVEEVLNLHRLCPYANLIGWDIALDTNGRPIVIEINLDNALLEAHQVFNGPIFGDRLAEVKEYIERRKPFLRHAMITY